MFDSNTLSNPECLSCNTTLGGKDAACKYLCVYKVCAVLTLDAELCVLFADYLQHRRHCIQSLIARCICLLCVLIYWRGGNVQISVAGVSHSHTLNPAQAATDTHYLGTDAFFLACACCLE